MVDSGGNSELMDNGFTLAMKNTMCVEKGDKHTREERAFIRVSRDTRMCPLKVSMFLTSAVAHQSVPIAIETDQLPFQLYRSVVLIGSRGGRRPRKEAAAEGRSTHNIPFFCFNLCSLLLSMYTSAHLFLCLQSLCTLDHSLMHASVAQDP